MVRRAYGHACAGWGTDLFAAGVKVPWEAAAAMTASYAWSDNLNNLKNPKYTTPAHDKGTALLHPLRQQTEASVKAGLLHDLKFNWVVGAEMEAVSLLSNDKSDWRSRYIAAEVLVDKTELRYFDEVYITALSAPLENKEWFARLLLWKKSPDRKAKVLCFAFDVIRDGLIMTTSPTKIVSCSVCILLCFCLTSASNSTLASRLRQGDKTTRGEKRPKVVFWGASSKGLQMAVWVSPVRPIVFGLIRNASDRKIHYCDYLVGQSVELYARKSPSSEWVKIPPLPIPVENQVHIGGLRCSPRDTLQPGEQMKASPTAFSRNRIKGNHTFEVDLAAYNFSADWKGAPDCKIVQHIFGGRHRDGYAGDVESPSFTVKLPLARDAFE